MNDYYAILGVMRAASAREIKQAYRRLCREHHPDLNPHAEATARMQEINEAYHVLSSPSKRAEYDRWLQLQEAGVADAAQQGRSTSEPPEFCCEKCGKTDTSLRISVFTWVLSLIFVSYKYGWAKVLCDRCRVKYSLLFNLEVLLLGWWGFPFGLVWSLEALWWNILGGKQSPEHNAALLFAVGYRLYLKGDCHEAQKALEASLKLRDDPKVRTLLDEARAMSVWSPEPSWLSKLWTRRLHPAFYNVPALVVAICLVATLGLRQQRPPIAPRMSAQDLSPQAAEDLGLRLYSAGAYEQARQVLLSAATAGRAKAQTCLGRMCETGHGMPMDHAEAVGWYTKAAAQGNAQALYWLGKYRLAADSNHKVCDCIESPCAVLSAREIFAPWAEPIVTSDRIEEYKYRVLVAAAAEVASARWGEVAKIYEAVWKAQREKYASHLTAAERAEGERRAALILAGNANDEPTREREGTLATTVRPVASGTGFFVSEDGFLCTSYHVVKGATRLCIENASGRFPATVMKTDPANDLAVLKVAGKFNALSVGATRSIRLGQTVLTIGFPNIQIQGTTPKLTRGEINSLAGIRDDPRAFQFSAAIQPGNSGGPLLDLSGNVIGVVEGSLRDDSALKFTGALPQNVNYAVKGAYLTGLLETVPGLSGRLKRLHGVSERKIEDVASEAQQAVALVLVF